MKLKKIVILLILILMFTNIYTSEEINAEVTPGLSYSTKIMYIDGDALGLYPKNYCIVSVVNNTGYKTTYEVTSGKDLINVSKTGKVTLTKKGVGTAIVTVTFSKKGKKDIKTNFKVVVMRNASDVKLTDASVNKLAKPLYIGDKILLQVAKSMNGSYVKGNYGINNYRKVVTDNVVIESLTPEIAVANGFTLTAISAGVAKFVVKAYQYGNNKFTGIQSKVYTVNIIAPTTVPTAVPKNSIVYEAHPEIKSNFVSSHFPRWKSIITSYINVNQDNTISIIEALENKLIIETYNDKNKLISTKELQYELPIFGAYYSGKIYNYIVFGQKNKEENDNKEVIRVVKYDKDFNKIDSVSITGGACYTTVPFDAGAPRMEESIEKDLLIIHTSRLRYTTEDGLNHQSQLTIQIETKNMTVLNDLGRFQSNHVSHSFDQYVLFDGERQVLVDHGDAYPRSIVITRKKESYNDDWPECEMVSAFSIPGAIGANCTGVSVGGFEITDLNYLIAMNTIDHSLVTEYTSFIMKGLVIDQRDIVLCVVPEDNFYSEMVRHVTLGEYVGTDKIASIPKLVKINNNKLIVLWQEFDAETREMYNVKYIIIDENGNKLSELKTVEDAKLSTCNPIVIGDEVVWYTNDVDSYTGERTRYLYRVKYEE